ncbi:serine--tRNA ligase [Candidatus Woesearchaeota archaeon]|nr:serine--tRNA ligase [Candidatus Woesearchaeota archaeon]
MLDIKFVMENPDAVKKDLRKRQDKEKLPWVDEVVEKFSKWKSLREEVDRLRHSRNVITREINELKKQGKSITAKVKEAKDLPKKIADGEKKLDELHERVQYVMMRLPNVLHESVPVGKDDTENKEVKKWGKPKKFSFKLKAHGELLEERGLADFEKAAEVSGTGFHFIKGDLVLMEQALIDLALKSLVKKGYTPVSPPLIMRRKPYEGVTDLSDFEKVMYKIDGEDSYLIATSEHPIGAMMMNEVVEKLPLRFTGLSSCFRKEIGSHGIDTRGLFRVHQFNKVEQFIFCKPSDSWKLHEELMKNAEELMQKLKIPYRVVDICTGDIGIVAAKKCDIEAWFPRQDAYKEVVSCSNCTSYQAVRLNIKYINDKGEKEYLHTLNSTAIATGRTMAAIVENYQNEDGSITVPDVLQPYVGKKRI